MDIGEEKKEITFEPVEAPAEQPVTPEPVPAEPVPDAEPVPVGSISLAGATTGTTSVSSGASIGEFAGV